MRMWDVKLSDQDLNYIEQSLFECVRQREQDAVSRDMGNIPYIIRYTRGLLLRIRRIRRGPLAWIHPTWQSEEKRASRKSTS